MRVRNFSYLRCFFFFWFIFYFFLFLFVYDIYLILIRCYIVKLVRFFPPIVTGSVVTIIRITLIPVAINNMGGGQDASDFGSLSNISLAFGTLLFIIIMYRFSKGFMK